MVTYAKCCYPLPGDTVIGHLSAGKGIVVHRDTARTCSRKCVTRRKNASR